MTTPRPILGTPTEQREQRLAKMTKVRTEADHTSKSLEALSLFIENAECPVNAYRPVWLQVARRIRQDAADLQNTVRQKDEAIEALNRHIRAESTFGPSPHSDAQRSAFDLNGADWIGMASLLDLEKALIEATRLPEEQQDAIWIRMISKRMDEIEHGGSIFAPLQGVKP